MTLTNPTADLAERGCILTGIPRELVFSPDRSGRVSQIRFAAWHIARKDGWTLHALADVFRRDHGSVIHGLKVANELLATDKWFRELVRELENESTNKQTT